MRTKKYSTLYCIILKQVLYLQCKNSRTRKTTNLRQYLYDHERDCYRKHRGSEAFTLDDDACRTLRCYLDDIRSRLPEDDTETMGDIERRIAEIFRERVSSPMRVITLDVVRATMNQMGTPAAFGEPRRDAAAGAPENGDPAPKEDETPSPRKLYRSRTERSIAGVCGGLGEYFDADPTMIRLVTLLLILFGGLSIWAYIILWIVIPEQPARKFTLNDKKR